MDLWILYIKMNTPEKIYIGIVPSELGNYKYTTVDKDFPDAIEYIKMDAFIEKLDLWLYERGREYHGEFDDGFLIEFDKSEEAIKDFIKYIKEEWSMTREEAYYFLEEESFNT